MKVSQEAREAAANITFSHLKGGLNWMHAQGVHDKIVAGKWDHHPAAQAFAAFEQSIRDDQREKDAMVAERFIGSTPPRYSSGIERRASTAQQADNCINAMKVRASEIAAAIRQIGE